MDNLVRKAGKALAVLGIVQRLWPVQQCLIRLHCSQAQLCFATHPREVKPIAHTYMQS